jgi:hypothetical protein
MDAFTSSLSQFFVDKLNKLAYAWSYYKAGKDKEIMDIAEEGMQHYIEDLEENDY